MNGFLAILCFWTLLSPLVVTLSSSQNITNNGLPSVLSAVTKLLDFFKKNYQGMTLDTVFGLRVIEGQCKLLAEEHENGELEFVSKNVITSINDLGIDAGKLANMAVPHTLEQDREYFGLMKQLTVAPWKVFQPHRVVNPSLRWNFPLNPPDFTEIDGDVCMSELMSEAKQSKSLCKLTEGCLNKMLAPGQLGHHLQRQIFYTIVAKKMGCEHQVNDYLVSRSNYKNLDQVQHVFCTNAYYELEETTAAQGLTDEYRDLFLETEFICPSIGYFQFMRSEWLDAIITWQSDEGCFPKSLENASNPVVGIVEIGVGEPRPQPVAIPQQPPKNSPHKNFQHQAVAPMPERYHQNNVAGLADEEPPQYVTLASPNMVRNAIAAHVPTANQYHPVYAPVVPQNHNGYGASVGPQQHPQQQLQQHYDVPFVVHSQVQNPGYGAIHGYQDQDLHEETYQQVPSNKLADAPQVPQPLYAWNNDVAYVPYEKDHNDDHNLPQVVPHHNRMQYGIRPQDAEPRQYVNPIHYAMNAPQHQQHPQQSGVEVNPYLREYHQNRGLKSILPIASNPEKPMRERFLLGGCLSHFTSMASAALSVYLRYLVDPGPPEFLHLRLENFLRHNAALKKDAAPLVAVSSTDTQLHMRVDPGEVLPTRWVPMAAEPTLEPNVQSHHSSMGGPSRGAQNKAKLNDMMSHAWNFMGTYTRYYGGKFHQPIHAGSSVKEGVGMVPDYVHKAEVNKELPDWTVALKKGLKITAVPETQPVKTKANASEATVQNRPLGIKEENMLSTSAAWVRHKDVNRQSARKKSAWQKISNPKDINVKERQMEVHIIEIQSPFQRDLDHYFIAVTLISIICLFVLFRYFRQRRNVVRSKARIF